MNSPGSVTTGRLLASARATIAARPVHGVEHHVAKLVQACGGGCTLGMRKTERARTSSLCLESHAEALAEGLRHGVVLAAKKTAYLPDRLPARAR
jgi:hypothetical protein